MNKEQNEQSEQSEITMIRNALEPTINELVFSTIKFGHSHACFWSCALGGEIGELCNVLKKLERDYNSIIGVKMKTTISEELADTIIYCMLMSKTYNFNLAKLVVRDLFYLNAQYHSLRTKHEDLTFGYLQKKIMSWKEQPTFYGTVLLKYGGKMSEYSLELRNESCPKVRKTIVKDISESIASIVVYCVLIAKQYKINLTDAIVHKMNIVGIRCKK